MMDKCAEVEVIAERHPDAYAFTLKTLANGRLHRVVPAREPGQPRFWCIVVYRCSPGGLRDPRERSWVGPGGLRREDLKTAFGAIRQDPEAWLGEAGQRDLREWMLAAATNPTAEPNP